MQVCPLFSNVWEGNVLKLFLDFLPLYVICVEKKKNDLEIRGWEVCVVGGGEGLMQKLVHHVPVQWRIHCARENFGWATPIYLTTPTSEADWICHCTLLFVA